MFVLTMDMLVLVLLSALWMPDLLGLEVGCRERSQQDRQPKKRQTGQGGNSHLAGGE
jgi:hypothetical protein